MSQPYSQAEPTLAPWESEPAPILNHLHVRIGHYEIQREIAVGGMGSVFEAIQDQPRRSVALKLMRGARASPAAVKRFEKEAQLLARLQHPCIAQVYEAGTHACGDQSVPYIAMEFVQGARPITEHCRAHKLTRRRRLELFLDVCDAVHHGHVKGIIHRDVKPGNVLVDGAGHVKIIDFGVSRALDADPTSVTMQLESEQLIGTLQYMSPEQCDSSLGEVGVSADIYALGVLLYELLCGKLPYEVDATNIAHTVQVIREQPPIRPATIDRSLRGDLETILLKALHKDPARRYHSAEQLGEDVRRLLQGQPVLARGDSLWYLASTRLKTAIAKHQVWAALAACVIAVVFTQTIGVMVLFHWTRADWAFQRTVTRLFPPSSPNLMSTVRIVSLREGTDAEGLAKSLGIEGIQPGDARGARRLLWAHLLRRLAETASRAVAFDVQFITPTEHDQEFVDAVNLLKQKPVDVVMAVHEWLPNEQGLPRLAPLIAPHVRPGGVSSVTDEKQPWRASLFALPNSSAQPLPSLAVATLAAFLHPGAELSLTYTRQTGLLVMRFSQRHLSAPAFSTPVGEPKAIVPNTVIDEVGSHAAAWGLRPESSLGLLMVEMPGDAILRTPPVDLDLVDVLRAPQKQLREWFDGRVVVIGDARVEARDGPFEHSDGRVLPGFCLNAAAIDMLIRGEGVRVPYTIEQQAIPLSQLWGIELAAAGLGAAAVALAGMSLWRRSLYLLAAAVGMLMLSLLAYGQARYLCNPLLPIIAMVVAGLFMSYAVTLRRRVFG